MSTISTAERREAAARLRTLADGDSPMNERSVDALYTALGFPWSFGTGIECSVIRHLADLIDRQTCHLIEDEDGYTACSECGCTALCMRDATYCPACGRVIVND